MRSYIIQNKRDPGILNLFTVALTTKDKKRKSYLVAHSHVQAVLF